MTCSVDPPLGCPSLCFPQLPSAVTSTVDPPLGSPSLCFPQLPSEVTRTVDPPLGSLSLLYLGVKILAGFSWTMLSVGGVMYVASIIPMAVVFASTGLEIGVWSNVPGSNSKHFQRTNCLHVFNNGVCVQYSRGTRRPYPARPAVCCPQHLINCTVG